MSSVGRNDPTGMLLFKPIFPWASALWKWKMECSKAGYSPIDIISTSISNLRKSAAKAADKPETNVAKAGVPVKNQMCDSCLQKLCLNIVTLCTVTEDMKWNQGTEVNYLNISPSWAMA